MENNNPKQNSGVSEEKPKIVNLCEDMNAHEHDDASYQKMLLEQQKAKQGSK